MSIIYKFKITSSVLPTTLTYRFSHRCAIILQSELFSSSLVYPSLVNSASATDLNLINLYLQSKLHSKVLSTACRRSDIQKIFINLLKIGQL